MRRYKSKATLRNELQQAKHDLYHCERGRDHDDKRLKLKMAAANKAELAARRIKAAGGLIDTRPKRFWAQFHPMAGPGPMASVGWRVVGEGIDRDQMYIDVTPVLLAVKEHPIDDWDYSKDMVVRVRVDTTVRFVEDTSDEGYA